MPVMLSRLGDRGESTEQRPLGEEAGGGATHRAGERGRSVDSGHSVDAGGNRPLPLDVTFELLKNRRRRLVLEYLRKREGPVPLGELAEHIAALENDVDVGQLDSQQRKRVYIGLYQCHLPKMDDAGVIDFEQNRGRVTRTEAATHLYQHLDTKPEVDDEPHLLPYALFTLGTGVAFVSAQALNAYTIATATVVCFLLVSLAFAAGGFHLPMLADVH